ncbi:MAG: SRPBCC family protein [Acidobacteriota bacterium]|nr:SRPBCC family protein [Acidobacteriota bacterium]
MVPSGAANGDSFTVTTPSTEEIRLTRVFDAPRHLVFAAMTRPEHVKEWWGRLGDGYSVPVCEIDLRPGGAWRFVNRHPKGEIAFYGEYREITPPSRLVFTEIFEQYPESVSVVTAEFTDQGGKTRLTATVRYMSQQVRDSVLASGMARGAGISYDRLEDLVARLARS